ncbi:hypothetical protein [Clostridium acetobutylicum]|uniref:hypothetical protein n=1 Tax=Clostridium acetobutylicum TaxID=1488 RepID=UPI0017F72E47|nr:hypothetical protein [Clostridium acetobutylicum]NYC96057.1 hypothetical protein [Clostridium acetobutylicum]
MHKKTKLICIGILATAIVTISIYNFDFFKRTPLKEHKVKLVIDAENKNTLPPKFRTTSDTISLHKKGSLNLSGLSDLNASGSGAFSEDELKSIKNKIGNKPIVDIDLRQESHIFVNGIGISWYGKNDDANLNLTSSEVLKDENNKLMRISKDKKVTFDKLSKKEIHK